MARGPDGATLHGREKRTRGEGRVRARSETTHGVRVIHSAIGGAFGNTPIRHLPLSMSGLAREALQMSDHARNAEIVVGELPVCHGEPVLIGQVWANLIGNAFKYSRTRDPAKIEVGWDGGRQAYFVRDNGIGFDMQFAGKLFDAFERLHSEPAYEGSGIGLAIVGRIVQRHGGRIWADSAPEKGATFWFTLPA